MTAGVPPVIFHTGCTILVGLGFILQKKRNETLLWFVVLCDCVQYQVGQLFSVAEASKNETGGGEGIQVLKNEPYEVKGEKGQYTHKLYHIKRYVVSFFLQSFSWLLIFFVCCNCTRLPHGGSADSYLKKKNDTPRVHIFLPQPCLLWMFCHDCVFLLSPWQ